MQTAETPPAQALSRHASPRQRSPRERFASRALAATEGPWASWPTARPGSPAAGLPGAVASTPLAESPDLAQASRCAHSFGNRFAALWMPPSTSGTSSQSIPQQSGRHRDPGLSLPSMPTSPSPGPLRPSRSYSSGRIGVLPIKSDRIKPLPPPRPSERRLQGGIGQGSRQPDAQPASLHPHGADLRSPSRVRPADALDRPFQRMRRAALRA